VAYQDVAIDLETETPCFRIEGLKYIETVHLDVTGSKASGDYLVAKQIVWVMRIVDHHAHLFIPTNERFNDTTPAHYVVTELEYLPCDK
jgi:hypothetical protein